MPGRSCANNPPAPVIGRPSSRRKECVLSWFGLRRRTLSLKSPILVGAFFRPNMRTAIDQPASAEFLSLGTDAGAYAAQTNLKFSRTQFLSTWETAATRFQRHSFLMGLLSEKPTTASLFSLAPVIFFVPSGPDCRGANVFRPLEADGSSWWAILRRNRFFAPTAPRCLSLGLYERWNRIKTLKPGISGAAPCVGLLLPLRRAIVCSTQPSGRPSPNVRVYQSSRVS